MILVVVCKIGVYVATGHSSGIYNNEIQTF